MKGKKTPHAKNHESGSDEEEEEDEEQEEQEKEDEDGLTEGEEPSSATKQEGSDDPNKRRYQQFRPSPFAVQVIHERSEQSLNNWSTLSSAWQEEAASDNKAHAISGSGEQGHGAVNHRASASSQRRQGHDSRQASATSPTKSPGKRLPTPTSRRSSVRTPVLSEEDMSMMLAALQQDCMHQASCTRDVQQIERMLANFNSVCVSALFAMCMYASLHVMYRCICTHAHTYAQKHCICKFPSVSAVCGNYAHIVVGGQRSSCTRTSRRLRSIGMTLHTSSRCCVCISRSAMVYKRVQAGMRAGALAYMCTCACAFTARVNA
jgi:hypothetical protein